MAGVHLAGGMQSGSRRGTIDLVAAAVSPGVSLELGTEWRNRLGKGFEAGRQFLLERSGWIFALTRTRRNLVRGVSVGV